MRYFTSTMNFNNFTEVENILMKLLVLNRMSLKHSDGISIESIFAFHSNEYYYKYQFYIHLKLNYPIISVISVAIQSSTSIPRYWKKGSQLDKILPFCIHFHCIKSKYSAIQTTLEKLLLFHVIRGVRPAHQIACTKTENG